MNESRNVDDFDDYYSLESFFHLFFNDMKSKDALKVFPNLKELLNSYLIKLSQKSKEKDFGNYQFFRKIFNFPEDNYYISEWNIQKVIAITKNKYKVKNLPIDLLLIDNIAHKKGLNTNYNTNSDDPIIVIYYPPNQEYIIVDGNHRFYKAIEQNDQSISAYVIYPDDFLKAMSNDLCRSLYKIHNNINIIFNIAMGNLKLDEDPIKIGLDNFFELEDI
jgi:hypothetical protein